MQIRAETGGFQGLEPLRGEPRDRSGQYVARARLRERGVARRIHEDRASIRDDGPVSLEHDNRAEAFRGKLRVGGTIRLDNVGFNLEKAGKFLGMGSQDYARGKVDRLDLGKNIQSVRVDDDGFIHTGNSRHQTRKKSFRIFVTAMKAEEPAADRDHAILVRHFQYLFVFGPVDAAFVRLQGNSNDVRRKRSHAVRDRFGTRQR